MPKLTIHVDVTHEVEVDGDLRGEILENLHKAGVSGKPSQDEFQDVLRDMWSENPDSIFELGDISTDDITITADSLDAFIVPIDEGAVDDEDEDECPDDDQQAIDRDRA